MGMGELGCGPAVVGMSRRVTGVNLVPICSFLVLIYLWDPGVLIFRRATLVTSTISPPFPVRSSFPHLSVIPVPREDAVGSLSKGGQSGERKWLLVSFLLAWKDSVTHFK